MSILSTVILSFAIIVLGILLEGGMMKIALAITRIKS